MFRTLAIATMLALAFVPSASALGCIPEEPTLAAAGGVYVTSSGAVYSESNARAGLQTSAGQCSDENGRDFSWGADTKVL